MRLKPQVLNTICSSSLQTSHSVQHWLRQHGRQPPRRMVRDLVRYGHIQRFQVDILAAGLTIVQADNTEEDYIRIFKALGPAGYNNLPGCPGRSRMFWWRHSTATAQQKLRGQMHGLESTRGLECDSGKV